MKTTAENQIVLPASLKKSIAKMQYYSEESFLKDANAYIEAIKNGSMCCIIHSVAKSGMSRTLKFHSCTKNTERYNYRQYIKLFEALGYKEKGNTGAFTVNGCGMDMIFHTNYSIMHIFKNMGIITADECRVLAQHTPTVL
jgi:hypothetical protein